MGVAGFLVAASERRPRCQFTHRQFTHDTGGSIIQTMDDAVRDPSAELPQVASASSSDVAPRPSAAPESSAPFALRLDRRRIWLARGLALAADFIQIVALPLFGPGLASPLDEVLDLAIGVVMIRLLGWHVAFLPTFVAELIPFVDIFPTWTLAVLFVTRRGARAGGGKR